ncbi:MAG: hypothetical protein VZQ83_08900 [Eubacterium sp.]|nr:hypothetical protein [Eubacterium sp.]
MTFPNAAKGIKTLFIGELLALISAISIACSIIFSKPVVSGEEVVDFAATGGQITVVAILLSVGGLIAVVAYIMQLVGIAKTAKDEEAFKSALYLILFSILFSIAGAVLAYVFPTNNLLSGAGTVVTNIIEILVTFLVIGGIGTLGAKLNDATLQEKAAKLLRIIVTVIVLRLIANIVILLFKESIAEVIVTILGIVILVFSLVQYIAYLSLLATAKNTLANK